MSYKEGLMALNVEIDRMLSMPEVDDDDPPSLSTDDLQRVLNKHKNLTRVWDVFIKAFGTSYKREVTNRRVNSV